MSIEKRLSFLLEKKQQAQNEISKLEGQKEVFMQELKELGFNSVPKAREYLDELATAIVKLDEELSTTLTMLEESCKNYQI